MTELDLILCLSAGAVAGWWAGAVFRGRGYGLMLDLLLGVGGATLAGWLFVPYSVPFLGLAWTLIWALLGAAGLLYLVRRLRELDTPPPDPTVHRLATITVGRTASQAKSTGSRAMSLDTLQDLLLEQVQDVYYAEKHLMKALPRMAKAVTTPRLARALTDHLEQTREQVARLERVFEALGVPARGKKCPAIEGLIQEAAEMLAEDGSDPVRDAGLIACAQRVEHYEIAAYGSLRALAETLGLAEVVELFDQTLAEELAAADLLTDIGEQTVLPAALALAGPVETSAEHGRPAPEGSRHRGPSRRGAGR